MYKLIMAKFPTKCSATKKRISKGDFIIYNVFNKKVYIPGNEPKNYSYTDDGRMVTFV